MSKHPSHVTRDSDASTFDEICIHCGATDQVPGGWGELAKPCPSRFASLRDEHGLLKAKAIIERDELRTRIRLARDIDDVREVLLTIFSEIEP